MKWKGSCSFSSSSSSSTSFDRMPIEYIINIQSVSVGGWAFNYILFKHRIKLYSVEECGLKKSVEAGVDYIDTCLVW